MKQVDLWGNEIEVKEKSATKKMSIKEKFRKEHGYVEGSFCKNCRWFIEYTYNRKKYFKCQKIGVSMSAATDIRKGDKACGLYEEVSDETAHNS